MPRLLQKFGLKLEASMAYVLAEVGRADYWAAGMLNSLTVLLPKAGLVDQDTAEAFVAAQRQASDDGIFSALPISTHTLAAGLRDATGPITPGDISSRDIEEVPRRWPR